MKDQQLVKLTVPGTPGALVFTEEQFADPLQEMINSGDKIFLRNLDHAILNAGSMSIQLKCSNYHVGAHPAEVEFLVHSAWSHHPGTFVVTLYFW